MVARQLIRVSLALSLVLAVRLAPEPAAALKLPAFFSWMQQPQTHQSQHQHQHQHQRPPVVAGSPPSMAAPNPNQAATGQQPPELADSMMASASGLFEAGRLAAGPGSSPPAHRKPFQSIQMMLPGKHNQMHLFSSLPKSLFGRLLSSSAPTSTTPSMPALGHLQANQFGAGWPQQSQQQQRPLIFTGEPTSEHQHFHHLQYRQQVPKAPFGPTSGLSSHFQRPQFAQGAGEKHALGLGETADFVLAGPGEPPQLVRGLALEDGANANTIRNTNEADDVSLSPAADASAANNKTLSLPAQEQAPLNATLEPKLATGKLQPQQQELQSRQNETSGPVTTQSPTITSTAAESAPAANGTAPSDWSLMQQAPNATASGQGQESAEAPADTREDGKVGSGPSAPAKQPPRPSEETSDSLESSAAAIIVAPGEPSEGPGGELTSDEQVESFILGPYRGHHSGLQTSSSAAAAVAAHEMLPEGPNQFGRELQQLQQLMAAASQPHLSQHQQPPVLPPPPPPPQAPAQPVLGANFHHRRPQLAASVAPGRLASSLIQQAKSLIQLPFVHMQQQQPLRGSPLPTREPLKSQPSMPFVSHQAMGGGLGSLSNMNGYHHHHHRHQQPQQSPLFALPQHQQRAASKQSYFLMAPSQAATRHLAQSQQPALGSNQPRPSQQPSVPYYLAKPAPMETKPAGQPPFRLLQVDQQQQRQPVAREPASTQTAPGAQQRAPGGSKFKSGLYQIEPPKLQVTGSQGAPARPQPEFQQQRLVQVPELNGNAEGDNEEQQLLERKPNHRQVQQQQQQQQQVDENDEEDEQASTERPEFARQVGASMGVVPVNSSATKAGQVFNEPLGPSSSEQQQQQGSRSLSEFKTLKLSQDITLYDFETPAMGSPKQNQNQNQKQQHQPISFLDTQVYTLPFALPQPQRNHFGGQHHHHFRQQLHQPQAQASYLHQHQLGRFPLAYSAPPPPQLPAPQYQRQQPTQAGQQQAQAQPQAQSSSPPQQVQKPQVSGDFRSPFKALYQEFAGGPQVGGAGQVDWAPAQALGIQTFSDDSAASNELHEGSLARPQHQSQQQQQQQQQHYFHYQPLSHHQPQQQHQQQHQQQPQGYELPPFGAHLSLQQPGHQQHQFVLAIQHQHQHQSQATPPQHALFSSGSMAVAPPGGSLANEQPQQLVSAVGAASTEASFVEALTSAAPPAEEASTQPVLTATVQELAQPQVQQQQQQAPSAGTESSNVASNDDDGFGAAQSPSVAQNADNNGQQRAEAHRGQQQQPEQSPSVFCAGRAPGLYADESQRCRAYYQCAPTGHQMFRCNNQTQFNQKTQNCDWWYNVDCAGQAAGANPQQQQQQPQQDDGLATAATTSATPSASTVVSPHQQDREASASSDDRQHQHMGSVLDLQSEERKQLRHWSLPTAEAAQDQRQSGGGSPSGEDLLTDLLEGSNATSSALANGPTTTTTTNAATSAFGDNLNDQSAVPAPTSATPSLFGGESAETGATTSSATTQEPSGKPTEAPSAQSQPQVGADDASAAALTATTSAGAATTTAASTSTAATAGPEDDQSVLAQQSQQPASSPQQISQLATATPPSTEEGRAGGERRVVQSEFGVGVATNNNKAARSAAASQRFEFLRPTAVAVAPSQEDQATGAGLDEALGANSLYSLVESHHSLGYPKEQQTTRGQSAESQATRERPRKYERRFGERLVKV